MKPDFKWGGARIKRKSASRLEPWELGRLIISGKNERGFCPPPPPRSPARGRGHQKQEQSPKLHLHRWDQNSSHVFLPPPVNPVGRNPGHELLFKHPHTLGQPQRRQSHLGNYRSTEQHSVGYTSHLFSPKRFLQNWRFLYKYKEIKADFLS